MKYTFMTPAEIAERAEELIEDSDDTRARVADRLGVTHSAVSHALNDPGPRRIKLLSRILAEFGHKVHVESPAYPVE